MKKPDPRYYITSHIAQRLLRCSSERLSSFVRFADWEIHTHTGVVIVYYSKRRIELAREALEKLRVWIFLCDQFNTPPQQSNNPN